MRHLRAAPALLALLALSCHASYPTVPTPTVVGLQVLYGTPMSYALVGTSYPFHAYAIWSDGGWEDVTVTSAWSSSDPQVLAPGSPMGYFRGVNVGRAEVRAAYQSMVAALSIPVVRLDLLPFPRFRIGVGSWSYPQSGLLLSVYVQETATSVERLVTTPVTWTSTDPSVATVDGGRVTPVGMGTTTIIATTNGQTLSCGLSMSPLR